MKITLSSILSVLTIEGANNLGTIEGGSGSKYEIVLFLQLKSVTRIKRIDYSKSVVDIRGKLDSLRSGYLRAGVLIGFVWWLMWIPVAVALRLDDVLHPAALYPSLISGDFMQTGSGSLAFTRLSFTDYAGLPPLTILGSVDVAGDLLLGFDEGFSYAPFARLTLIGVGGARTGLFDNYAGNALVKRFDSRRAVYIDYTEDGDIALYTTPLPPTWLLFGLGLLGWYEVARRPG